ncbi:MAG: transglycosylase SLT domain-containing protein [Gammaproteobacteria bacterium]
MIIPRKRIILKLLLCLLAKGLWAAEPLESPETLRQFAINYEHGRAGIKQDYQQAFDLYCQAALKGDAESTYNIGYMYFNGRGRSRDLGIALYWFEQAAEAGDKYGRKMVERYADVVPVKDEVCKPQEPELRLVADANPNREIVKNWVEQIAPFYGIDSDLVMAVIRAESAFNSRALSNKNAQGLMQLIPETAERFGVKDSWDPIQNIKGGTAYLNWLLRHFDGKVELVLAAYNAGEGAVERYHGVPPYQETREYVKRILAWYPKSHHPVPDAAAGRLIVQEKI